MTYSATGQDSALNKKRGDILLKFEQIVELVTKKLDPFETKRLVDKLGKAGIT